MTPSGVEGAAERRATTHDQGEPGSEGCTVCAQCDYRARHDGGCNCGHDDAVLLRYRAEDAEASNARLLVRVETAEAALAAERSDVAELMSSKVDLIIRAETAEAALAAAKLSEANAHNALTGLALTHMKVVRECDEARAQLTAIRAQAATVMRLLDEHGAGIVPHLIDSDDNAGQRLRSLLGPAPYDGPVGAEPAARHNTSRCTSCGHPVPRESGNVTIRLTQVDRPLQLAEDFTDPELVDGDVTP